MTAFLFIPATADAPRSRRVDFANIASLFAEVEDAQPRRERGASAVAGMNRNAVMAGSSD